MNKLSQVLLVLSGIVWSSALASEFVLTRSWGGILPVGYMLPKELTDEKQRGPIWYSFNKFAYYQSGSKYGLSGETKRIVSTFPNTKLVLMNSLDIFSEFPTDLTRFREEDRKELTPLRPLFDVKGTVHNAASEFKTRDGRTVSKGAYLFSSCVEGGKVLYSVAGLQETDEAEVIRGCVEKDKRVSVPLSLPSTETAFLNLKPLDGKVWSTKSWLNRPYVAYFYTPFPVQGKGFNGDVVKDQIELLNASLKGSPLEGRVVVIAMDSTVDTSFRCPQSLNTLKKINIDAYCLTNQKEFKKRFVNYRYFQSAIIFDAQGRPVDSFSYQSAAILSTNEPDTLAKEIKKLF